MKYFFETTDTILPGHGFKLYGSIHIMWLVICFLFIAYLLKINKSKNEIERFKLRRIIAIALLMDEIYKHVFLIIGGNWTFDYLPLHLCSINIFMALFDSIKPNKTVRHFISLIAIPGALMALLSPSWTKLPLLNFMHIHSFTVHILLIAYPVLLLFEKENKPETKYMVKALGLLIALLVPIYFVNKTLGTNFFFLMEDEGIAIFLIFKNIMKTHLMAIPVLGSIIMPIMIWVWSSINKGIN